MRREDNGKLEAWLKVLDLRRRTHFDSHEYSKDNQEVERTLNDYNSKYGVFNMGEFRLNSSGGWIQNV